MEIPKTLFCFLIANVAVSAALGEYVFMIEREAAKEVIAKRERVKAANAKFDRWRDEAIQVTKDECYGEFIRIVPPPPDSTRQPAVVLYGFVIKPGQEKNYYQDGGKKGSVILGLRSSWKKLYETAGSEGMPCAQ